MTLGDGRQKQKKHGRGQADGAVGRRSLVGEDERGQALVMVTSGRGRAQVGVRWLVGERVPPEEHWQEGGRALVGGHARSGDAADRWAALTWVQCMQAGNIGGAWRRRGVRARKSWA
jgi:hypothetical protein